MADVQRESVDDVVGHLSGVGVGQDNVSMAVSPDTYPIVSACVGVVGRRWRLIYRSVATLVIGLTATAATAAAVGGIVGESHRLGAFSATSPSLAGLVTDRRRNCRRCAGR